MARQRSIRADAGGLAPGRARLALLHYTAPPVTGGVEAVVGAQARLLRQAGHDVRIVAGRGDAVLVPELDSRHPATEALTRRLGAGTADQAEFDRLQRRIARGLRAVLRDRDLVIAHNVLTMPFNLPLTAALHELEQPLVAWTHDVAWSDRSYADFRRPHWPYHLLGRAHRRATYVVVSHARREVLAEALGLTAETVAVVPNGIDPLEFAGLGPAARRLLAQADALHADPLVLVPQRVNPNKRLELALRVAAELAVRHPRARLLVTGPVDPHDGASVAYAGRLLEQRAELGLHRLVHFLFEQAVEDGPHPVGETEIMQLYRLSDVVLLLSRNEGFGLPLLEAALARVPIVCTDIRPFREVGGDGVRCFPAGAGPTEIAAALELALAERPVRHRRAILGRYAWSAVQRQIEGVIAEALGRESGPAAASAV